MEVVNSLILAASFGAIALIALYWTIKTAVKAALREHQASTRSED